MKNKFSVSTNTYHGFSLDDALEGIAQAGFKYVELTGVAGWTEHVNWQMNDEDFKSLKDKLSQKGLTAIALSGHCNIIAEDGMEAFLKNVDLAARLGCQFIVTGTGETHGDKEVVENESVLIDTLRKITKKCEQVGVCLVLETHGNNYNTGQTMYNLVSNIDSDFIGINYDTANVIFYGNVRPEDEIVNGITRLKFVHLKDKAGANNEWNFPAIGKGYIDFPKIFSVLRENNYDGPISVEIEFTPDGPGSLEAVNQAVKDSFDHIQKITQ